MGATPSISPWPGRGEDARLLAGCARFAGDVQLPRMVEAVFVRSPVAHADIVQVDASAALNAGALAVLTAADLPFIDRTLITRYWHPAIRGGQPPLLAVDRVRYVGEAVAMVIAGDRYQAEDLSALVEVDYRALPVVADPTAAVQDGSTQIHDDWPGNVAAELSNRCGDAAKVLAGSPRRLQKTFAFARQAPMPLETRGCVAEFDAGAGRLTLWSSTQVHYNVRNNIAEILDVPEDQVRVVAEDVGGGFGSKSRPYAEEVLVSHASRVLGRPVRWIEDRLENFQATTHSRGAETALEIGYDNKGRILALRGCLTVDIGAYVFTSGIVTAMVASGQCAGPYRIDNIDLEVLCVGTNRTPLATYRGAGQPEATFPIERLIDLIAADLNLSPADVRQCNIVRPSDMPYAPSIPYAGPDTRFESGDYPAMIERLTDHPDYHDRVEEAEDGACAAWGLACGMEATGYITGESAQVRIDGSGNISLWSGMSSQGQGQPTTYARVCAEILGVAPAAVTVRMGDTDVLPFGRGAFASRGAVVGANAVAGAAEKLRDTLFRHAATLLQCQVTDLDLADGIVRKVGESSAALSFSDIARAVMPGGPLNTGELVLEESFVFNAPGSVTFALSVHAAKVAVDLQTGFFRVAEYRVVHDAGRMLDETIVNGQITGGAVDGIGCAMLSAIRYDDEGQLLTGTMADYLVMTAADAPAIHIDHVHSTPTTNPLGVRGVGEGGVLPAPPAIANALARIIDEQSGNGAGNGDRLNTLPLTPEGVLKSLEGR